MAKIYEVKALILWNLILPVTFSFNLLSVAARQEISKARDKQSKRQAKQETSDHSK